MEIFNVSALSLSDTLTAFPTLRGGIPVSSNKLGPIITSFR